MGPTFVGTWKEGKTFFSGKKILFLVLIRWQKCIMFNRRRFCISTKQQTFCYQISQFQTYQIFILLFLILKTFEIIFKILDLTKWQAPKPLYVYSDLETESFKVFQLLQIAAISSNNDKFSIYINPQSPLPENCLKVTGPYFHKNQLYQKGCELPSVSITQALRTFA